MPKDESLDQFPIDLETKRKLYKYIDILSEYKNDINLIGEDNRTSIIEHLLIPSILSAQLIDKYNLMDIGSGSGIVGIPLKIVNNSVKLILCEKNSKKIAFLNHVLIKLDIKDVILMHDSFENIKINSLQNVDQLLIRGIKIVDIYKNIMEKFPRGTSLIYFGPENEVADIPFRVVKFLPMPGNARRQKSLFIYSLCSTWNI